MYTAAQINEYFGGFDADHLALVIPLAMQKDPDNGVLLAELARRKSSGQQLHNLLVMCRVEKPALVNYNLTPTPASPLVENIKAIQPPAKIEEPSARGVLADPEVLRLVSANYEMVQHRAALYAFQLDDSGNVEKTAVFEHLKRIGVVTKKRTFDAILKRGYGKFWTAGAGRNDVGQESLHIYLTGQKKLARSLTAHECRLNTGRADTPGDRPGKRRILIDLTGDLEMVYARCYAAWIETKKGSDGFIHISRARLEQLWNRSTKQLLKWEKLAGIKKEMVFAECADIHSPLVPAYAYLRKDVYGNEIATWRRTNRYKAASVTEHAHNGQRSKVRDAANRAARASKPLDDMGEGLQSNTGRLNFTAREYSKRSGIPTTEQPEGGYRGGHVLLAVKRLQGHLDRHRDYQRSHYMYVGKRRKSKVHIQECAIADVKGRVYRYRNIDMKPDYRAELDGAFLDRREQFRTGWEGR